MTREKGQSWLRISVGVLALLAFLWACYKAQDIILLVLVAVLVAYALSPLVGIIENVRVPFTRFKLGRGVAAGAVVVGLLFLFGILLSKVVPAIAVQVNNVVRDAPYYVTSLQGLIAKVQARFGENSFLSSWLSSIGKDLNEISAGSGKYIGRGLFTAASLVVKILSLIVLPIATFYLLKDGKRLRQGLLQLFPDSARGRAEDIFLDIDKALSSYVRGLAAVCLIMATMVTIALAAVGVNYPLVLGLFAGACEVIPFVGFVMASIAIVLVGFFEDPWMGLKGFIAYASVNQVLSNLITPRVMGARMKLHPLTAMISVMVGAKLAGVAGVVFALPAVSVGKVLLLHLVVGGKAINETSDLKK